jgi:hypothetical protein
VTREITGLTYQYTAYLKNGNVVQAADRIFIIQAPKDGHIPYPEIGEVLFSCK